MCTDLAIIIEADGWSGAVCAPSLSGGPSAKSYLAEVSRMAKHRCKPIPLEERFWPKVDVRGLDDCWEWRGSKDGCGYGMIKADKVTRRAHRVSWRLHNGPIPKGMQVLHHCDNPGCMNPAHLFLGSNMDNVQDKVQKGRQARGNKLVSNSKLTIRQVREIKSLSKVLPGVVLSKEYKVCASTISLIKKGKIWKWIK